MAGAVVGAGFDAAQQLNAIVQGRQDGYNVGQTVFAGMLSGVMTAGYLQTCFTPDTLLETPNGEKRIDQFSVGDPIFARAEANPFGDVAAKVVEEVFVSYGYIFHLHVAGQVIKTTSEHPFYVLNKGWTPAGKLETGDLLSSRDGQWVAVVEVYDTGEYQKVYNLRVQDYHTYFVGSEEWGFSVWAHNGLCSWQ